MGILPPDFNPRIYLELNPDLEASNYDPAQHYIEFGIREKRPYRRKTAFENFESKYPKLAILLMCKDEGNMLDAWIKHHITIVPPQHLFIFDNGSTDVLTTEILLRAESLGCNVERKFASKKHFLEKGFVMKLKMQELDVFDDFDFYIPLDADELLAVKSNDHFEVSSDAIHSSLSTVPNLGTPLKIVTGLLSHPYHAGYFLKTALNKTFFRRETVRSLDVGYHWGQTIDRGTPIETAMTLVDFHQMGLDEVKRRARQRIEGRIESDSGKESLDEYASKQLPGFHSLLELNLTPEIYIANLPVSDFSPDISLLASLKKSGAFDSLAKIMSY